MSEGHVDRISSSTFTLPFWQAAERGELAIQHCKTCGFFQHYPRPRCLACASGDLEWTIVSGKGLVYAFTITRRLPANFGAQTPYIVASIELSERVRILANIRTQRTDLIHIGMSVKAIFEKASAGMLLVQFIPTTDDVSTKSFDR
jgi:uncharacterized OB-fold protein